MADETGSQRRSSNESIPRPRIQTLSDLIFGLALSIGAIALLSEKPTSITALAGSIVGFGWAFLILALVWVRYTRIMSVLPVETGRMVGANVLLLFLVSIEPYLYNLITFSYASLPGQLDPEITTALYAIDMGSIFLILSYFTHELTIEEKRLIPRELLRSYRLQRNAAILTAAFFLFSILPVFWSSTFLGVQLRFVLWMGVFLVWAFRREFERRRS